MFEENEISKNAYGGTEIAKRTLSTLISPELQKHFQVVSSRVRELEKDKIRIFYAHDLPEDPESAKFRTNEFRDKFHKFVFISNWQYQRYQLIHNFPADDRSIVIESGIQPELDTCFEKKDDSTIRLVYTSTPQRGLDILVPVFERLAEHHPDIHLDVFSSFKIYGWDEADRQFEPLYDKIRNNPKMTYHGFVPNNVLKEHLTKCHIFAYPCTWMETSCRAMLEAMSAGLLCVHSNIAALPETSGSLNVMYHSSDDMNVHAHTFMGYLDSAIKFIKDKKHNQIIRFNKMYVDNRYNITRINTQWENMLNSLLQRYPTEASRAIPEETITFKIS